MAGSKSPIKKFTGFIKGLFAFVSFKAIRKSKLYKKFKGLNRNVKLAIILVLVLIIVGAVSWLATRSSEIPFVQDFTQEESDVLEETENLTANVTLTEGTLEIKNEDSNWEKYTVEAEINEDTSFRTSGATSRAVIALEDGSEIRLDGNSEIRLTTLSKERVVIKHVSGYTYNRVIDSSDLTYVVGSENAQYEALGTAFRTSNTGDEQAVEVFHSSVIETASNTTVKEGEKLIVKDNQAPSKDGTIEDLDIERIKTDPFIEWNKDLDLANDSFKNDLGYLKDFDAPDLQLSIKDGDVVLLDPNANEGVLEVTGNTDKNTNLTVQIVSEENSGTINVSVGDDGKFKTPVLTAPIGDATIKFVATDKVGNKTEKTVRITFQRKSGGTSSNGITLFDASFSNGVELSWSVGGSLATNDGFKVVYSIDPGSLTYEQGDVANVNNSDATSKSVNKSKFDSGGTYYFKVCRYISASDTCDNYSNQQSVFID